MAELRKLMETYLKYCEVVKELNPKTIKAYRIDLTQFYSQINCEHKITDRAPLNEYIARIHQKYEPRATKRKIACLKAFYRYLEFEDIIHVNLQNSVNLQANVR